MRLTGLDVDWIMRECLYVLLSPLLLDPGPGTNLQATNMDCFGNIPAN